MSAEQVWFITGASSGFGRAIAEVAVARGHPVIATARDVTTVADLGAHALALDVSDPASVDAAVARAVALTGGIDVLVNNAGYGLLGAVEDVGDAELRAAYETNLFGPMRLARAVLPGMRRRGGGRIVQMSSVIGVTSGLGGSAYAGPKAALAAMSESLAAEVAGWGIRVTIVEPGAFRTDFSGRSLRVAEISPPYAEVVGPPSRAFRDGHGTQAGDPRRGAEAIVAAVALDDPPLRLPLGDDASTWIAAYLRDRLDALEAARPLGADTAFA
ncbi:FabG-like 3-oxoacyl-(acyl-carrier-protein) reductase [Baekduia alba]|uniref:SDR family NAD(P)-dependent oxidoreductase n=1 Tax=Baekduia alba TaxID=2997333 RepID=UPI0023400314|nr:SDR family NAD(P)-dependent oxidoreductase [Baekduia alba]WCB93059.1 FabG-like 3-oxoacyl-(acyl-carrier-protein) reductase [Baekduia alba]